MKRIIVACDGTGQSASRGENAIPSNVSRFCHALSNSSNIQQIIFYQSGVGTQDLGAGWGLGKVIQALGKGLEDHVADGYHFIMNNFKEGDEIFLFGFSRGAFTARVIANIVGRLGVIVKEDSWAFKDAMQAHKDGTLDTYASTCNISGGGGDRADAASSFSPRVFKVEIQVVGCWDTVASLGVPWKPVANAGGVSGGYKHFNGGLVKGIKHAFHALALDECRGPFTPTLWHLPPDSGDTVLRQCWFPGVHSNVGGGYPDRALANLTLAWMIDQCEGLLDFDRTYLDHIVILDRAPSQWHKDRKDRKGTHDGGFDTEYQGWARGMCYDSYKEGQTWTWKYRTPGAYTVSGQTQETMHASVRERWQSSRERGITTGPPIWKPMALKGFELRKVSDQWEWVKKDSDGKDHLVIAEFSFPEHVDTIQPSSLEWRLRYRNEIGIDANDSTTGVFYDI